VRLGGGVSLKDAFLHVRVTRIDHACASRWHIRHAKGHEEEEEEEEEGGQDKGGSKRAALEPLAGRTDALTRQAGTHLGIGGKQMTWLSAQSAQTEQSPRGTNSQAALASHTIWWPLLPQQAEPGLPTTEPWSVEQVGEGSASQRGAAVESLHDSPRPQTTCCPGAPQQESPTSARGRCWLSKPRHDAGVGAGAGVGTNAGSAVGSCTGAGVEGPELAGVGASAGSAVGSDTGAGVEGPELVEYAAPVVDGVGASAGSAVGSDTGAGVEGPELVEYAAPVVDNDDSEGAEGVDVDAGTSSLVVETASGGGPGGVTGPLQPPVEGAGGPEAEGSLEPPAEGAAAETAPAGESGASTPASAPSAVSCGLGR